MKIQTPIFNSPALPELLAPAGSKEKLEVAIEYGADAVYLAGLNYGLRTSAQNFTPLELQEGVALAHAKGVKVYVTLNSFLHDEDFVGLSEYLGLLADLKVDGLIVSDLGIASLVHRQFPSLVLHISTQASVLNTHGANFFKALGAKRIILGREVSLEDARSIKQQTGLEVELFIHGSRCMSYSGHCVISNFTQGRDSNRGGCAHSCRFKYTASSEEGRVESSHLMSSKDLQGLEALEALANAGIDSLKIEGRMKSELYLASVCGTYRQALNYLQREKSLIGAPSDHWEKILSTHAHRDGSAQALWTGQSLGQLSRDPEVFEERQEEGQHHFVGKVLWSNPQRGLGIQVKYHFTPGERLFFLDKNLLTQEWVCPGMKDLEGNELSKSKPSSVVVLPFDERVCAGNLVFKLRAPAVAHQVAI